MADNNLTLFNSAAALSGAFNLVGEACVASGFPPTSLAALRAPLQAHLEAVRDHIAVSAAGVAVGAEGGAEPGGASASADYVKQLDRWLLMLAA